MLFLSFYVNVFHPCHSTISFSSFQVASVTHSSPVLPLLVTSDARVNEMLSSLSPLSLSLRLCDTHFVTLRVRKAKEETTRRRRRKRVTV